MSSEGNLSQLAPFSSTCPTCRNFNFEHEKEISYLGREAMRKGCTLCTWVRNKAGSSLIAMPSKGRVKIVTGEGYHSWGRDFELVRKRDRKVPENDNILGRDLQTDPSSDASFELASSWLSNCLKSHSSCPNQKHTLPTSVIDLTIPEEPILYEAEAGHQAHYITLSHCWGKTATVTTTTTTLSARKQQIYVWSLPKTFRDAIEITRQLGLQYLWIDSLCILQDSKTDWSIESAKMGEYYQNSYLTVSVLSSENCHGGILNMRTQDTISAISDNNLFVRDEILSPWTLIIDNALLSTRAWKLQERLMSTRILHYSHREMFWECLTCSRREGSAAVYTGTSEPLSQHQAEEVELKRFLFNPQLNSSGETHIYRMWHGIVKLYSTRALTKVSDKLPALSGMATTINLSCRLTYMAGLWKEDPSGLLWVVDTAYNPDFNAKDLSRAPSWSWVSVDRSVSWKENGGSMAVSDSVYNAVILQVDIKPKNFDPMGEVQAGGRIVLWAFQKRVRWIMSLGDTENGNWSTCQVVDETGGPFGSGTMDTLNIHDRGAPETIYCLAVMIQERTDGIYFLLVIPVDASRQTWRRIGIGCLSSGNKEFDQPREIVLI